MTDKRFYSSMNNVNSSAMSISGAGSFTSTIFHRSRTMIREASLRTTVNRNNSFPLWLNRQTFSPAAMAKAPRRRIWFQLKFRFSIESFASSSKNKMRVKFQYLQYTNLTWYYCGYDRSYPLLFAKLFT